MLSESDVVEVTITEKELGKTQREGGFGSTGIKKRKNTLSSEEIVTPKENSYIV